jgi:hypothetical protein
VHFRKLYRAAELNVDSVVERIRDRDGPPSDIRLAKRNKAAAKQNKQGKRPFENSCFFMI